MKYWIPGIIALLMIPAVQAVDYRLAHSPTLQLEVFIDDVKNSNPESWCMNSIPLRITSAQSTDTNVLNDFLPRVGNLLEKQCAKVAQLLWVLTDKQGNELASGSASKSQSWKVVVQPAVTNSSDTTIPPAVAVTSPLATQDTIASFALPQGCQFRTYWNSDLSDNVVFVPSSEELRCDANDLVQGPGTIITQQGGSNQTHSVVFYQGYPLANINTDNHSLTVIGANAQRLILGASDSFLVLPFNPQSYAWAFQGEVIIEMTREQAADRAAVSQRVARANETWRPLVTEQGISLIFRLVETLAVDRVDPASGSYLSVNDMAY
ncbi:type VI secretion system-associated protein [Chania multitudinisentens RB-25]|uniref:Type VI secretion system-associated protein n=1 Tax=Chania multitudinisentens RB-25 TaxID=1441930 RepID=W0LEY2_9GAMM|nr:hypothetical protein [Chania multitudinisentens]AHG20842.1 type VI secretion system-associated protein [Chania multitudinisentens RB-25]